MIILTSPSDVAFTIKGFPIYYYGICMALAVLSGFYLSFFITKKDYKEIDTDILYDVITVAILGGFVCARLYYCLVNYGYYSQNLAEIFNFRQGGLAIHGGLIGGVLFGSIYAYIKKYPILKLLDIFAYGLLLAQAVGRWGNFFNNEAFGLPARHFIGVFIPETSRISGYEFYKYFHPTFLYESILNILALLVLYFVVRNVKNRFDGLIFAGYLILYSIIRFLIEGLRLDCIVNVGAFHLPQIVSIITIFIAILFIFVLQIKQKNKAN